VSVMYSIYCPPLFVTIFENRANTVTHFSDTIIDFSFYVYVDIDPFVFSSFVSPSP
jgi:hypothetical protein